MASYYSSAVDLGSTMSSPHAAAVVADGTPFAYISRGVYVGGAGNVVAVLASGSTVTFPAVPLGTILPIRATAINTSTATSMVAMF